MALAVVLDSTVERTVDRSDQKVRRDPFELPCRAFDPDLWFSDSPTELELAKSLCGDCRVRAECLAGAEERCEPWGVWGGEIFERGAVVARKRPRGRPRKADLARDAALLAEGVNRTATIAVAGSAA
jgi:WhiB family transcriptional regulator, redox-sensing transcriptional regulator